MNNQILKKEMFTLAIEYVQSLETLKEEKLFDIQEEPEEQECQ